MFGRRFVLSGGVARPFHTRSMRSPRALPARCLNNQTWEIILNQTWEIILARILTSYIRPASSTVKKTLWAWGFLNKG